MRGEPWQIMYSNTVNLLDRAAFLHKYPCTREETVKPCLPGVIKDKGLLWDNARLAMKWTHYSQFFVDHGSDVTFFWVMEDPALDHVTHWPTPSDHDDGFVIPKEHSRYHEIAKWAKEAEELDRWLADAKNYLSKTLKVMKHPMWVERFWPEIVPYVGKVPEVLVNGMREPRPTQLHLDMALQDEIQNKLTLSSLLPADHVQTAWIGRYPS